MQFLTASALSALYVYLSLCLHERLKRIAYSTRDAEWGDLVTSGTKVSFLS